jgi:hypothetical protein
MYANLSKRNVNRQCLPGHKHNNDEIFTGYKIIFLLKMTLGAVVVVW